MTLARRHAGKLWNKVAQEWRNLFTLGKVAPEPDLANAMRDFLDWQSLQRGASLRYRAHKEISKMPPISVASADAVPIFLDRNTWARRHHRETQPIIQFITSQVVKGEREFLQSQALVVEAGVRKLSLPDAEMLIHRQRRFFRDNVMEVVNTAEQVQLADPHVGERFPFAEYHTREDQRVRPTHHTMDGLVAVRTWEGWAWCRPPCGYGCRCGLRFFSASESQTRGWMTKEGKPKFEVKWPSPRAKALYLRGVPLHGNPDPHAIPVNARDMIFPDAGPWMLAKFTAGTGLPNAA